MKRFFYFVFISVLVFSVFTRCSKNSADEPDSRDSVTTPVVNPPSPWNTYIADSAETIYLSGGYSPKAFALRGDGSIKWQKTFPAPAPTSPLYYDGRVFFGTTDGKVYAFDTLGELKWTISIPSDSYLKMDFLVDKGKLYVSSQLGVECLDPYKGTVIWSHRTGLNSSQYIELFQDRIFYRTSAEVECLDASTGDIVWKSEVRSDPGGVRMVVTSGLTYVPVNTRSIVALNTQTGQVVWWKPHDYFSNNYTSTKEINGMNFKNGRLYVASYALQILDSATGNIVKTADEPFVLYAGGLGVGGDGATPTFADSFAVSGREKYYVFNAITLEYLYTLPASGGENGNDWIPCHGGVTVVGSVFYYTTNEKGVRRPDMGLDYMAFLYGYDYRKQEVVLRIPLLNTDPHYVCPCIVSKSGRVYRGGKGLVRN